MSRMNGPRLSTHVDLEHLFKVGDRVDHVVGPFLLDGDSSAVNTSRELSVTGFELLGKVLLGGFDSLHRHTIISMSWMTRPATRRGTHLLDALRLGNVDLDIQRLVSKRLGSFGPLGLVQHVEESDEGSFGSEDGGDGFTDSSCSSGDDE